MWKLNVYLKKTMLYLCIINAAGIITLDRRQLTETVSLLILEY